MTTIEPIVKTVGLSVAYKVGANLVRALSSVDLTVYPGEVCCLIGPSGSGKSTLLNQLAGLEKPTIGQVFIGGKDISRLDENRLTKFRRANMGFIFQSYNLLAQLTAIENVALPLVFHRIPKQARLVLAQKELDKIGLSARSGHLPNQLSGGQQQRIGIARAFIVRPKIIFADEPTGNLDSSTTASVLNMMLNQCKRHGITLVMVTHEQELALCADHTVYLHDGKIVKEEHFTSAEAEENRTRLQKKQPKEEVIT